MPIVIPIEEAKGLPDTQTEFDLTIGKLDNILSKMVSWGKNHEFITIYNKQTIKHHAEDMILAGRNILKNMGEKEI